jgi:hypothetical protein
MSIDGYDKYSSTQKGLVKSTVRLVILSHDTRDQYRSISYRKSEVESTDPCCIGVHRQRHARSCLYLQSDCAIQRLHASFFIYVVEVRL